MLTSTTSDVLPLDASGEFAADALQIGMLTTNDVALGALELSFDLDLSFGNQNASALGKVVTTGSRVEVWIPIAGRFFGSEFGVAVQYDFTGQIVAVIPEPSSWALALLGLVLLAGQRVARRSATAD